MTKKYGLIRKTKNTRKNGIVEWFKHEFPRNMSVRAYERAGYKVRKLKKVI